MKFPLSIVFLLLTLALPAAAAPAALRQGNEALAGELWEIAALHFRSVLAQPETEPPYRAEAAMGLAEALIRDGNAAEALPLLSQPDAAKHPHAYYWTGQALAGGGRFADAIAAFAPAIGTPDLPLRKEALFTCANLELSLGQTDAALKTLEALAAGPDPATASSAKLRQVEILLDHQRLEEARAALPPPGSLTLADRADATFLEASILLAEQRPDAAAPLFSSLLSDPQGQTLSRFHAAALGLADALAAQGNQPQAVQELLGFIQAHQDSPLLKEMFGRLLAWLPEQPGSNDPILQRLLSWIPLSTPEPAGLIDTRSSSAVAAWPAKAPQLLEHSPTADLAAFSLFTRAIGLHRSGSARARDAALALMSRLRFEHATHYLVPRSLLLTASWLLEQEETPTAFSILDGLGEQADSPLLRGEAAFAKAAALYRLGLPAEAAPAFEEASRLLPVQASRAALFNASIARLAAGLPVAEEVAQNPELQADLELEQALSATPPNDAKTALEAFLARHPDHPRAPEARLASAQAALHSEPPDLSLARAQLAALNAKPDQLRSLPAERVALTRLRLTELSGDSAATIAEARALLATAADPTATAEISLTLGRNLFHTGNFNEARIVLQQLARDDPDPQRAQAALLLAARSAALSSTPQSREEALALFDQVIEADGPLSAIAKMEKARLMIDLNRTGEAILFLQKWFQSLPEPDPLRLPAGLLLGEAIYSQGNSDPNSLPEALAIYDQLLSHASHQRALLHRLQYLRGMILEKLPLADGPGQTREAEALEAYYSVLESTADQTPAEWEWFENCGFRALQLMERQKRWTAAIAIAEKVASFGGPRAGEAATHAQQLRLNHMIWEE